MTPPLDRKPSKRDLRQGGLVAALVLVFLAVFTTLIVWIA